MVFFPSVLDLSVVSRPAALRRQFHGRNDGVVISQRSVAGRAKACARKTGKSRPDPDAKTRRRKEILKRDRK
jgi:hypothetical protein